MSAMFASYTLRRPAAAAATRREAIARVIAQRQFSLVLQPVVDLGSRAFDHHEVLLRLRTAEVFSPRAFVAAAEAEGLAPALDTAVLEKARAGPRDWSINVCARSLQERGFVGVVRDAGVSAIELVRLDSVDNLAAVAAAVTELRASGLRVALDEVDGGAASLALLQATRFDTLKLAGTVVRAAAAGERGRRLLGELMRLAGALGARVIATRIETLPQLWTVERAGAALAQGWLFGAPAAWRTADEP